MVRKMTIKERKNVLKELVNSIKTCKNASEIKRVRTTLYANTQFTNGQKDNIWEKVVSSRRNELLEDLSPECKNLFRLNGIELD